jgi:hypothetical protein
LTPPFICIANRHDIAGLGPAFEMQLDNAGVELTHLGLDAPLDRGIVRAVAGDEFLDNGTQGSRRQ